MSRMHIARDHFQDKSKAQRYFWFDTLSLWSDSQTKHFEHRYVEPLHEQAQRTLNRWDDLIATMKEAEIDLRGHL